METFLFYAWPPYLVFVIALIVVTGTTAAVQWSEGNQDDARRLTFWAVSSLWWPLIVAYYIGKAFVLLMITAYKGALLVMGK